MNWENEAGHDEQQVPKNTGQEQDNSTKSLMPLTIKAIYSASEEQGKFQIDYHEIHQLTIIAQIVDSSFYNTNSKFTLSDGTGTIEANMYNEDEDQREYTNGRYVRVIGSIQLFQGNRSILAFRIKPVIDENEITYHFLNVILNHNFRIKGVLPDDGEGDQMMDNNNNYNNQNGGSILQNRILEIFGSNNNPNGVHIEVFYQQLSNMADQETIMNEIQNLINEGHIYPGEDNYFIGANNYNA